MDKRPRLMITVPRHKLVPGDEQKLDTTSTSLAREENFPTSERSPHELAQMGKGESSVTRDGGIQYKRRPTAALAYPIQAQLSQQPNKQFVSVLHVPRDSEQVAPLPAAGTLAVSVTSAAPPATTVTLNPTLSFPSDPSPDVSRESRSSDESLTMMPPAEFTVQGRPAKGTRRGVSFAPAAEGANLVNGNATKQHEGQQHTSPGEAAAASSGRVSGRKLWGSTPSPFLPSPFPTHATS